MRAALLILGLIVLSVPVFAELPDIIFDPYEPHCSELWWYDYTTMKCQQGVFCDCYMWWGLHTFDTKKECKDSLKELRSA